MIINPTKKFKADKIKSAKTLANMLKPKSQNNLYLTNSFLEKLRTKDKYAHECADYASEHWDPNPDFGTGVNYSTDIISYYVTNGTLYKKSEIINTARTNIMTINELENKKQQLIKKPVNKKQLSYYEQKKIKGTDDYKIIPHYTTKDKEIIPNQSKLHQLNSQIKQFKSNQPKYAHIHAIITKSVTFVNTKVKIKDVYDYLRMMIRKEANNAESYR